MPALAGLLRAWRERALLTRAELAERAGLSERTIVGLETGRVHRPRIESVRLLADALGLSGQERGAFIAAARGTEPVPVPSGAASSEPGPKLPVVPAQLPADPAEFVGRAGVLRDLDALLPGEPRTSPGAVVVTGTGGVGKTALAIHWAHRVRDRFPDGQLYVTLRGYAPGQPVRPLQALTQLLRGLGVAPESIPAEPEAAAGLYRTMLSGTRTLVLLDDVRDPSQVRPLLPGGPGCLALITSRSRLTGLVVREGAQLIALDALSPDEARTLLASLLGHDRVAAEPGPAAELAAACGHLPLPLRIVAAKLADHPRRPIAHLVTELLEGDLLAGLEVPGDQRSAVRATLQLSYASLSTQARQLFRLLGLVPGPDFTPAAAAALAGLPLPRAGALLERLADANLVASPAPGRFAFHDLLRAYAAERTDAEDASQARHAARARLNDWYLSTADAAARLLYPDKLRLPVPPAARGPASFDDHDQALAWLDAERPNLLAAAEHAAEHGPRPFAWLVSDALRGYFWLRMITVDWLVVARAGLAAAQADGDLRGQSAAELSLGDGHRCQSRYEQAIDHYLRARERSRDAGWVAAEAAALGNLGNVYWRAGRLTEAAEQHTRSLALDRQVGSLPGQAASLANLGQVSRELGRLREAEGYLLQALVLDEQIGSRGGWAMDLTTLGEVELVLGRLEEAGRRLEEALTLHRELGDRDSEAETLRVLAAARSASGQHGEAAELARAAIGLARDTGNRRIEADALIALALASQRLGRRREAAEVYEQALALARQTSERHAEVDALIGLAVARQHLGAVDSARCEAERALDLARQAGYRLLEGQARTALATIQLHNGEVEPAIGQARQALAVHRETGHRLGEAHTLVLVGQALSHTNGPSAAEPYWQQALALFTESGAAADNGPIHP